MLWRERTATRAGGWSQEARVRLRPQGWKGEGRVEPDRQEEDRVCGVWAESTQPSTWLLDEWKLSLPFLAKGTRAMTLYFTPISKHRESSTIVSHQ